MRRFRLQRLDRLLRERHAREQRHPRKTPAVTRTAALGVLPCAGRQQPPHAADRSRAPVHGGGAEALAALGGITTADRRAALEAVVAPARRTRRAIIAEPVEVVAEVTLQGKEAFVRRVVREMKAIGQSAVAVADEDRGAAEPVELPLEA